MDRKGHVAAVAARQRGLVTHAQLLDAGVPRRTITRRLAGGQLHRLHQGVYLVGHAVPPPLALELAALLACGPTAALSHRTAGALYRIFPSWTGPIEVTIPDRRCRPRPGLSPHAAKLDEDEVTTRHGLRLTTPARTLRDLATILDPATLERATNEAQVLGLIPPDTTRPGITRSEAERLLLALLRRAGLPPTKTNIKVENHEVDALYEQAGLVVEMDGYAFHRTRASFENDRRRDAVLLAAGYRVMRVTWRQLTEEPEALVARLATALAR
ncbi:MAG: type IV toxin-antitoxin system AbiEi family antitoxin domain-containing protein [Solirubrobacteraceae bacterium]